MDGSFVALLFAGAFDPNQKNGSDIPAFIVEGVDGVLLELVELLLGDGKCVLPIGAAFVDQVDGQFDHLLIAESGAGDVDQDVANVFLAAVGSGR